MFLRLGTDFIAHLIAGLLMGYGLDTWFVTSPIFMIVFIILGFVAGCRKLFKDVTQQKIDENSSQKGATSPDA